MRRISVIALMAVALLAGSLTLSSASASSDDSFRLTAISKQFKNIDVPPRGESLGDSFVFNDALYAKKRLVGQLNGTCTLTRLDPKANEGVQQCLVTASLPDGDITTQGVIRFSGEEPSGFTTAVTGGTGDYAGAGGEVHVRFVSDKVTRLAVVLD